MNGWLIVIMITVIIVISVIVSIGSITNWTFKFKRSISKTPQQSPHHPDSHIQFPETTMNPIQKSPMPKEYIYVKSTLQGTYSLNFEFFKTRDGEIQTANHYQQSIITGFKTLELFENTQYIFRIHDDGLHEIEEENIDDIDQPLRFRTKNNLIQQSQNLLKLFIIFKKRFNKIGSFTNLSDQNSEFSIIFEKGTMHQYGYDEPFGGSIMRLVYGNINVINRPSHPSSLKPAHSPQSFSN